MAELRGVYADLQFIQLSRDVLMRQQLSTHPKGNAQLNADRPMKQLLFNNMVTTITRHYLQLKCFLFLFNGATFNVYPAGF